MPKVTIEVNMKDADSLRTTANMLNTWAEELVGVTPTSELISAKVEPVQPRPSVVVCQPETPLYGECDAPTEELDLDADGIPWDERIHASTQTKTQDGRWKKKRGVDQDVYEAVIAEYGTPTPSAADEAPAPTPVPEVPTPQPTADEVPAPTPVPEAPAPQTTMTYIDLFNAINANKIPADQVTGVLNQLGMKSLPQLVAAPEHIPTVAAALGLDG